MSDAGTSQLSSGLVYEDIVPVSWCEVPQGVSTAQILGTHQSNERVLRCFAMLEEYHSDAADEEIGPVAHELSRVEFKVNLLLDMVARLLVEHISLPAPVAVKMSGSGIRWDARAAPAVGSIVAVEVYLNQKYPSALKLYGVVTSVTPGNGSFLIDMEYREMSETVRSWIEKMIFRQHRRQIAHTRYGGRG